MKLRCCGCMQLKAVRPICEHCGWDENRQNDPHQLPIGTVLENKYVIGRVLGQGGFGITYMGYDTALEMPVAIKEYFPSGVALRESSLSTQVNTYSGMADRFRGSRERFLREAKTLARFADSAQIVNIFSCFQANNTAYIVMEYVAGVTLRDYVKERGKLTKEEALSLLTPVMKALQQVHEAGIVHRDISPDNIMLLPQGGAKLLDFGAVRDVTGAEAGKDLTKSTQAILKQGYAPLEQYRGRGDLGPWTDVYALCATFVFCLTGSHPPDAPERAMGAEEIEFETIVPGDHRFRQALIHGMALKTKARTASVAQLYREMGAEEAEARRKAEEARRLREEQEKAQRARKEQEAREKSLQKRAEQEAAQKAAEARRQRAAEEKALAARLAREAKEKAAAEEKARKARLAEEKAQRKQKKRESKKTGKPGKRLFLLAALVLAAALAAVFLPGEIGPKPAVPETEPVPETSAATQAPPRAVLAPFVWEADFHESEAFGTGLRREQVEQLYFLSSLEEAPAHAADASQAQDGSVLAWAEGKDVYIGAEGGVYAPEDSSSLFAGMSVLRQIHFDNAFFTEDVRQMGGMFAACYRLRTLSIGDWNVSGVTDMSGMFAQCWKLEALPIGGWDVSGVTDMQRMFYACRIRELPIGSWDTGSVRNMESMFSHCINLTALSLEDWDVSRVENMSQTFYGCSALAALPIGSWDVSRVTDMSGMFCGCSSLTALHIGEWDVSAVENMMSMFYGCSALTELPIEAWDISHVTERSYMFMECGSLKKLPW